MSLARKMAAKVVKYRRNMTLEPMNSYERHIIHTTLQEDDRVSTYSMGTEPNRRVVVAYEHGSAPREDREKKRSPRPAGKPAEAVPSEQPQEPAAKPFSSESYREWK